MSTIDGLTVRAYRVPTATPAADGTLTWDNTTLVVVRVRVGEITGRPGLVSCALSAVDIALWDAAARQVELPLCRTSRDRRCDRRCGR